MNARPQYFGALVVGVLALARCGALDSAPDEDLRTADFDFALTGIPEGGAEARAVLAIANTASLEVLSDPDEVGLTFRASENIVAYRLGDDSLGGTADDERFETLAELDAIPFIGPIAFKRLLAYATKQGHVGDGGFATSDAGWPGPQYDAGYPMSDAGWPQPEYDAGWPHPRYDAGYPMSDAGWPLPKYDAGYPRWPEPAYDAGYPSYDAGRPFP